MHHVHNVGDGLGSAGPRLPEYGEPNLQSNVTSDEHCGFRHGYARDRNGRIVQFVGTAPGRDAAASQVLTGHVPGGEGRLNGEPRHGYAGPVAPSRLDLLPGAGIEAYVGSENSLV